MTTRSLSPASRASARRAKHAVSEGAFKLPIQQRPSVGYSRRDLLLTLSTLMDLRALGLGDIWDEAALDPNHWFNVYNTGNAEEYVSRLTTAMMRTGVLEKSIF